MEYELIKIKKDKEKESEKPKEAKRPPHTGDWCGTSTLDKWDYNYRIPDYHSEEDIELFKM